MSTFKCTNPKNYALTLNRPYEVLEDEGDYILIINDNNKTQRYYKNLFEEDVIEIPLPPQRTEQNIIDSLNVISQNGRNIQVTFTDLNNEQISFSIGIANTNSNISCGVKEFDGLNGIFEQIERHINTDEDDMETLKATIFKKILRVITHTLAANCRFVLCSTNNNDNYEDYFNILDEVSVSTTAWARNPNSNNNIKVWILERN